MPPDQLIVRFVIYWSGMARPGKDAWLVEVEWPKDVDWTNGMKPVREDGKE